MHEDIKKYYEENYKNEKQRTNININKQLWIDYQRFCLDLSRKTKKKITASARIRLIMIEDMLKYKKLKTDKLF